MYLSIRRFHRFTVPLRTYRFGTNLSMDNMGYDLKSIQYLFQIL